MSDTPADKLAEALEADAADLWKTTNRIREILDRKSWVSEGDGPYTYGDKDKFRAEVRETFEEIVSVIATVQHPAQQRFHSALAAYRAAPDVSHRECDCAIQGWKARALEAETKLFAKPCCSPCDDDGEDNPGERLPPGMTLKDVWEVVRWLESREVIRVDTPAFETNKRRAFTYAALQKAVEAQKGGKG